MLGLIIIMLIAELRGSDCLLITVMGGEFEFLVVLVLGLGSLENDCRHLLSRSSQSYRLSAKILALLRLSFDFFRLRLTIKLKINFFCFKS